MADQWEEAAKQFKPSGESAATPPAGANEDWKVWQQGDGGNASGTPLGDQPASFSGVARTMGNQALRAGGAAAENLNPMPLIRAAAHPIDTAKSMFGATSNAVGRTREAVSRGQYGEAAKSAVGAIPIVGPQAEQIAREATGGQIPEAIGHAGGLALAGKVPGLVGKALSTMAPPLAESALGVRPINRAYGRTPGTAALEETTGVRPETVAQSARTKLGQLTPQLESAAARSTNPVTTGYGIDVIDDAIAKARAQNNGKALAQLQPLREQLTQNVNTGLPLARVQTPSGLLNLKRGFGEANVHNWNPETMRGVKGTAAQAYHQLGQEFERGVPEAADLNQRISSLIPVAERAEALERGPGLPQRTMQRVAAHTGAGLGAGLGYYLGGLPGAVAGGVIPEMLADPTTQMIAARSLHGAGKGLQTPVAKGIARAVPYLPRAEAQ